MGFEMMEMQTKQVVGLTIVMVASEHGCDCVAHVLPAADLVQRAVVQHQQVHYYAK